MNFLNSNSTEIYRMIRDIGHVARNELYVIKHEYVKKNETYSIISRNS